MIVTQTPLKPPEQILFSPDGRILAVHERIGRTKLFDSESMEILHEYRYGGKMVFSPDGTLLAFLRTDGIELQTIGGAFRKLKESHAFWSDIRFVENGNSFEASCWDGGFARWDVASGERTYSTLVTADLGNGGIPMERRFEEFTTPISSGRLLTCFTTFLSNGKTRYDASLTFEGNRVGDIRLDNRGNLPAPPVIASHGRRLAVRSPSVLFIWDLDTLKLVAKLSMRKAVLDAQISLDGSKLTAAIGNDTIIRVWSLEDGQLLESYDWNIGPMTAVCFAPDGHRMAAAASDGRIVVWDVG